MADDPRMRALHEAGAGLAAGAGLGELLAASDGGTAVGKEAGNAASGIFCLGLGLLICIGTLSQASTGSAGGTIIGLVLGGVALIGGGAVLVEQASLRRWWVAVYEGGVVQVTETGRTVLRWDDVASVHARRKVETGTRGPSTTDYFTVTGRPGVAGMVPPGRTPDLLGLAVVAHERHRNHLFRTLVGRWNDGEALVLEPRGRNPVRIDRSAVSVGGRSVPWDQVRGLREVPTGVVLVADDPQSARRPIFFASYDSHEQAAMLVVAAVLDARR